MYQICLQYNISVPTTLKSNCFKITLPPKIRKASNAILLRIKTSINSIADRISRPSVKPIKNSRANAVPLCGTMPYSLMLRNESSAGQVHCSSNINKHLLEALRCGVSEGMKRIVESVYI